MDQAKPFPYVLLIEDNPIDAELMSEVFEKYLPAERILVLHDGGEALDCLHRTGRFRDYPALDNLRLIILDLQLPLVDGHYILRQVVYDSHARTIPTIVLTSSSEPRDIFSAYKLGVNSYVVKPINSDLFLTRIRAIANYWLSINQNPLE